MTDPLRRALHETQADLEDVSSHLALIREAIEHGEGAATGEDLARRMVVSLVVTLGFERALLVRPDERGTLRVVADFGQTQRFGGPREAYPTWASRLARSVLDEGALLRWGGSGIGAHRRRRREVDADVIGLPLETGGEILGAVLCTEATSRPWTLARHRALELVGQSIAQVMALQRSRSDVERARQALEVELRDARSKLATKDERIDSLSTSLDVADRVKDTFLGLLSHELRTPLSAMLGYASLLQEEEAGPITAAQADFLSRIEANGRRLGHLLEDLLFLTQAESTRIRPADAVVELAPLVDTVRRALPDPADRKAPRFDVDIVPGAERLRGDPTLLRRLLFHLLDEAWCAGAGGRVRLEARPVERERVHLRLLSTTRPTDDPAPGGTDGRPLGLGPSLVRLCAALLGGRVRLGTPAGGEACTEVWVPSAHPTRRTGLGRRRPAKTRGEKAASVAEPRGRSRR